MDVRQNGSLIFTLEKSLFVAQTNQMKYVYGVILPVLIQVLIVYVVIEMNTGNGSFVGLGAYLVGLIAIPLTAIVNAIYIYANSNLSLFKVTTRCFLMALITPVLIILVSVIG